MTVLSVEVEAVLLLPATSVTLLAEIEAITVPSVVMDDVAIVQVMLSEVDGELHEIPVAVEPAVLISPEVKVAGSIASENTTVKLIKGLLVGSDWPPDWLTVTVGAVVSLIILITLLAPVLPAGSVSLRYRVKVALSVRPAN